MPLLRLKAAAKANSEVCPTCWAMPLRGASVSRSRQAATAIRHQVRKVIGGWPISAVKRRAKGSTTSRPSTGSTCGSRTPSSRRSTVKLRTKVTRGAGSPTAALAMVFKLVEPAQARWRAITGAHLVSLVRAGARFENGVLVERPKTPA